VAEDKDFQKRIQRISGLVNELDSIVDPAARSAAKHLIQLLMELHGTALERMLEVTFAFGDPGKSLIDQFGRDSLVSSLLVLYGLHPDELETRVARAMERLRPSLRKQGADVAIVSMSSRTVRLRISTNGHACGSTTQALRTTVEEALYEAAPDVAQVVVEGPEEKSASTFVPLGKLVGSASLHDNPTASSVDISSAAD
jgi:Fe-S cluster biogenesis protein NfuA